MKVFNDTARQIFLTSWVSLHQADASEVNSTQSFARPSKLQLDIFKPLRLWIESIKVGDRRFAHRLCQLIPAQCPFERDVKLFGKTLFHIPPMCKLNPVYEEVVALRFRALCYLADECGLDVSQYC